ncbi:hypothetical protein AAZX31_07G189500 [Glycine max]|uniref:uncharacterized protein n=1 Tax=Glycine max TaxID=3847 RepID=UPI001B35813A|nr:uncharacterized protein LOC102661199 [Glycine max]KAG4401114.1 hypothetical protein GLYMA_07G205700v4 [Glycine max]KAH1087784.1 hypothetical protein GYH30_019051 [Glycine max]
MEKENSDKEEYVMMLQRCVKKLHFGSWEEKEVAAKVIEEGLAKQDVVKVREMTSELGVVRVLVSMAVSEVASRHRVGLKALIHLSNGTHGNKALIVEAGILSILPKKIDLEDESISEFAHLLSSLSSQGTIKRRQDSACTNRNKTQWNDSSFFLNSTLFC